MALLQRLLAVLLRVLVAGEHAAAAASMSPENAGGGGGEARYARVFCFGNSLTDTGNNAILPATAGGPSSSPPYGMTYFHRPTGRSSDGRLVVDFLVEALRVPQPTPYLAAGKTAADFLPGTNFAVGGATALEPELLRSRGIVSVVPVSMSNQTFWFEDALQLLATTSHNGRRRILETSLFFFGEIGVNDYFLALASNHTVEQAATLVPDVVGAIRSAVIATIAAGARTVVVTGMIPLGCEPQLLALFPGDAAAGDYDPETGCDARFNHLAELHNRALIRMLRQLRRAFPAVAVHYADYYRPVTAIVASPAKHGFGERPLVACCGGGGNAYNFDFAAFCGSPASTVCGDPSEYVSWDGIHYTEAANRFVARAMLRGASLPPLSSMALSRSGENAIAGPGDVTETREAVQ
ncbi:GDSL esterase/lipase At1g28590-like [Oryza brachyantha]|uniref:GDSL esterase/lipase At1g28590-like n=1 Tax=Oryza brachyantha TaxID=4533 RepID=UPI001AD9A0D6|nr:GDSL esterase/lipase At1g28590-like [Oryza brachyantha]